MANWTGTAGNDAYTGTSAADTIDGRGGNDILYGLDGDDIIIGGEGNDSTNGNNENDTFLFRSTNEGYDQIAGDAGYDVIEANGAAVRIGIDSFSGIEEIDVVASLSAYVECKGGGETFDFRAVNIVGNLLRISATGNGNTLYGTAGADTLVTSGVRTVKAVTTSSTAEPLPTTASTAARAPTPWSCRRP
jgi:Ca2+-binding RTX toxin-like protein